MGREYNNTYKRRYTDTNQALKSWLYPNTTAYNLGRNGCLVHMYTCMHLCTYTQVHMHIYIYVYVYAYTHIQYIHVSQSHREVKARTDHHRMLRHTTHMNASCYLMKQSHHTHACDISHTKTARTHTQSLSHYHCWLAGISFKFLVKTGETLLKLAPPLKIKPQH